MHAFAAESENLRAALEWSKSEQGDAEGGLRLVGALWSFWLRSRIVEGRLWVQDLLARTQEIKNSAGAWGLNVAANLAMLRGDPEAIDRYGLKALELSQTLGDTWNRFWSLYNLAIAAQIRGEHERGLSLIEEALPLARSLGEPLMIESALDVQAQAWWYQGEHDRAVACYEEALSLARQWENWYVRSFLLHHVAEVHLSRGDYRRALMYCEESVRTARELRDDILMSWALLSVAGVFGRLGNPADGAKLFGAADTALKRLGAELAPTDPLRASWLREAEFVRRSMGDEAFATAYSEGSALNLEQAVEIALEQVRQLIE